MSCGILFDLVLVLVARLWPVKPGASQLFAPPSIHNPRSSPPCLVPGRGHQHHGARPPGDAADRQTVKKNPATEIATAKENEPATASLATNLRRAASNGKRSAVTRTGPRSPSALSEATETVRHRPEDKHQRARGRLSRTNSVLLPSLGRRWLISLGARPRRRRVPRRTPRSHQYGLLPRLRLHRLQVVNP